MAKVICKLPNASEEISGVKFESTIDGIGMISEEISDEQAASFMRTAGYALADAPDAEMVALTAQATELGIKIDSRWKAARLTAEIAKATQAAEDAAAAGAGGAGQEAP
jgi:uncharacterized protein YunC (DUF1805 family)